MTALVVVLMFVGFVVLDVLVRAVTRRLAEKRAIHEREAVLQTAVRVDYTGEEKSLKRVEVTGAKARILAVDDEPVVLDSLRKILVIDGYSVDTVESGPEAVGLIQRHDYDFVFTDLKMPGMDGVEVVKSVKHLRPDTDVAVITGYATIESAVATMQYGAIDYVQKPFTAEELSEFARKLLIKREARLEAHRRPTVRVVAPAQAESVSARDYCVPGGAFISNGHTWVRIEPGGHVRVGLDDFARKALGRIDRIELPREEQEVRPGDPLFGVVRGSRTVHVASPLSGRVTRVHRPLSTDAAELNRSPYERGWVCLIEPSNLSGELTGLRIGKPLVDWYQEEILRLQEAGGPAANGAPAVDWNTIEETFLKGAMARV